MTLEKKSRDHPLHIRRFHENSIVKFPLNSSATSSTQMFGNDFQCHCSPKALEEGFCARHPDVAPGFDKPIKSLLPFPLSSITVWI